MGSSRGAAQTETKTTLDSRVAREDTVAKFAEPNLQVLLNPPANFADPSKFF
jgi:hypothetical protein